MRLAAIFSDHMVMQRDKDNYIFGESDREERITVSIDDICVVKEVEEGSWSFTIPAHKAGGPYEMTVEAVPLAALSVEGGEKADAGKTAIAGGKPGDNEAESENEKVGNAGAQKKVIKDVLYGEVWLDNGQSNIEFELQNARGGQEELKSAAYPEIRYFKSIKTPVVDEEVLKAEEGLVWHRLENGDFAELSGVGYYYAEKLYRELGVPVGMIDCYQGGSSITCWLEHGILAEMPEGKIYLDEFEEATKDQTEEDYNKALNEYNALVEKHLTLANKAKQENPDITQEELDEIAGCYPWPPPTGLKSAFRPGGLIETMMKRVAPYSVRGIIYYQGEEDAVKNYNNYCETGTNTMYMNLLKRMIVEYRDIFHEPELPVVVLQLPMYIARGEEDKRDWAYLREAQEKAVDDSENVMMISLIDAGEFDNVHPVDKKTPGVRTAREVLDKLYGGVGDGAVDLRLKGVEQKGDDLILTFDNTYGSVVLGDNELIDIRGEADNAAVKEDAAEKDSENGMATGQGGSDKAKINVIGTKEHIYGLEISDNSEQFYVPESHIDGETIVIKNAANAKIVRYGFFNYGKVNVYNGKGMPLRPFSYELG